MELVTGRRVFGGPQLHNNNNKELSMFALSRKTTPARTNRFRPEGHALEDRQLLSVTSPFAGGVLTLRGNGDRDFISLAHDGNGLVTGSATGIRSINQSGVNKIGLAYSADGATVNSWKFASHNTASTPSDYATGWNVETFNNTISIDDHISAVSDGANVYIAMKDSHDSIWLEKGSPGNWQAPVKVVNGVTDTPAYQASRPTLVLDKSNDQLYVMYQERVVPYGDIYAKRTDTDNLSFNPDSLGTRILQTYSSAEELIDPQPPVHPVTSAMDNQFFVVAKNEDVPEIWYNDIDLNVWV